MADALHSPGQLLVARVGDRLVGLAVDGIVRVLPMLPLWRPPTLPRPVSGFVAARGEALPVLDAHVLFGIERQAAPSLYAHILELRVAGHRRAGLLVDRADGFAAPAVLGALEPGNSLNGCATALFGYGEGALAYLVSPDRLLGRAEGETLAALTLEAERRRAEWQVAA